MNLAGENVCTVSTIYTNWCLSFSSPLCSFYFVIMEMHAAEEESFFFFFPLSPGSSSALGILFNDRHSKMCLAVSLRWWFLHLSGSV